MVKIRLTKVGRKGVPAFRLCVINAREKRESKAIEYIGHYSPMTKEFTVDAERVKYWMSNGAQPSTTVARLLIKNNVLDKSIVFEPRFKQEAGKKSQERTSKKAEKAQQKAEEAAKPAEQPVEEAPVAEEAPAVEEVAPEGTTTEEAAA